MLKNFEDHIHTEKLKTRTRKGIPDCHRGVVWQKFAEIAKFKEEKYTDDYKSVLNDYSFEPVTEEEIKDDIDKTFIKNVWFRDKYLHGQRLLFSCLKAYEKYNKNVLYIKGMAFLGAIFLTYMDEQSTFWMLHSLIDNSKYNLKTLHLKNSNSDTEIKLIYYKLLSLLKKHVGKVYDHFKAKFMHPSMYASQWFLSLFSANFKFELLTRFLDVYLLEREKVVYRIALGLLKINEERIINAKHVEEISTIMTTIGEYFNIQDLFNIAFEFSISKTHLKVN